ncbi:MAG: exosortase-associated EpsI family protein, partial [Phycisphaerales bacterium]|nr:exosortase-associated EpsI family protein [Phycisphaerales bacterium]
AAALPPAAPGSGLGGLVRAVRGPAMVVALAVFGATAAGMGAAVSYFRLYLTKLPIYAPDNRALVSIPTETENWRRIGDDRVESPEVQKTLGTENYVTRNYVLRSTEGTSTPLVLALHAAYYTGTIDTVPHVPERCFVGGGMEMGDSSVTLPLDLDDSNWLRDSRVDADPALEHLHGRVFTTRLSNQFGDSGGTRVRLPLDPHGIQMRITRFLAPGEGNVYAGYFFVANGGTTASAEGVRLLAFRLEDDYAYYLKVQVTSGSVGSEAELRDAASGLLGELLGEIMRCAPDWVEVERGEYPADNPRRASAGENGGAG